MIAAVTILADGVVPDVADLSPAGLFVLIMLAVLTS